MEQKLSSYNVYEGGLYTVNITLPCPVSDALVVTDCDNSIVSVSELDSDLNNGVIIYPNPSSNKITVVYEFKGTENIRVMNSLGQDCSSILGNSITPGPKSSIEIEVQSLATGFYILEIENLTKSYYEKFMVE